MICLLSGVIGFSMGLSFHILILFVILCRRIFSPLPQPFLHLHRLHCDLLTEADVPAQWFEGLRDLRKPCMNGIVRFCIVQLAALGQQSCHSLFLYLAVSIQLVKRVNTVVQQKLHLPDAFVYSAIRSAELASVRFASGGLSADSRKRIESVFD